jgi:PPOX class probable F420-dependent enzyme
MRISRHETHAAFTHARVARLATVTREGRPHLVPVTFAVQDEEIATAVDHKPKSTRNLRRLDNIQHNPHVALLVDEYDEDWTQLWWGRADGVATITETAQRPDLMAALIEKYAQYQRHPPREALIVVRVERWVGWLS